MPNIKSAAKKLRKDQQRTALNERWRRRYKGAVKKMRESPTAKNFKQAQKELDKAASHNVIKKNKAARLKSRLSKLARHRQG